MYKLLFSVGISILPIIACAHGDSPSLEGEVDGYLVDIGMSQEGIRPGETVTFDFDLFTTDDRPQFVHFSTVRVLISGQELMLDERIPNDGVHIPTLAYTFENEGDYQLNASFLTGSTVIASQTFDLKVEPRSGAVARFENATRYVVASVLVAFTVAYGIVSFLKRNA